MSHFTFRESDFIRIQIKAQKMFTSCNREKHVDLGRVRTCVPWIEPKAWCESQEHLKDSFMIKLVEVFIILKPRSGKL